MLKNLIEQGGIIMNKNKSEILFKRYKLYNHEFAFEQLYFNLEPLLKKVITNVTYVYKGSSIENQKYSKIHDIESALEKNLSMSALMEKYKDEYIKQMYCEDYNRYSNKKYSLSYPFWELVNELTLNDVLNDMKNWKTSFEWYLATKFCDKYWIYLEKCLRRDFGRYKTDNKKTFQEISFEDQIKNREDSFYIKNDLFIQLDTLIFTKALLEELQENLTKREKQVYDLLLLGHSHNTISQSLNISLENSYKIKSSIESKLKMLLKKYN